MPSYDYICTNCGLDFEASHSMFIDPMKICPRCGQNSLIRQIGIPRVYVKPGDDECTLGLLADRNATRYSEEQKYVLKEKHKTKKQDVLEPMLGKGMSIKEYRKLDE
jgi:putative FmdB family regulatory protein